MENRVISKAYCGNCGPAPLTVIRVRAAAGDPRRGWLTAGGQALPVALGRGGIRANKREGDGGTPKGTFRPRRLWWRADRHPQPQTHLPVRPNNRLGSLSVAVCAHTWLVVRYPAAGRVPSNFRIFRLEIIRTPPFCADYSTERVRSVRRGSLKIHEPSARPCTFLANIRVDARE